MQFYARAEDGDDTRPLVIRPYRGLLSFQPEHERFFFGREKGKLRRYEPAWGAKPDAGTATCIVAGASGTGKSSVVSPGGAAFAAEAALHCVILRPGSDPEGELEKAGWPLTDPQPSRKLLLVVDQLEDSPTSRCQSAASALSGASEAGE